VPPRKTTRTKALLAIAFTSGLFTPQLPALCQDKSQSVASSLRQIADNTHVAPEVRAYYLLKFACSYAKSQQISARDWLHCSDSNNEWLHNHMDSDLTSWANRLSVDWASHSNAKSKSDSKPGPRNAALADTALGLALTQLNQSSNQFAKLNMYYIASRLYQKLGKTSEAEKYENILEKAFESSEESSPVDEVGIESASSILNSMSLVVIPVEISDLPPQSGIAPKAYSFTEKEFHESEKLRLRAAKMLDRLSANNQSRRMAHRDLVLWYSELGKLELVEKQKQSLFELVGTNDDSILYAQQGACGQLVWWETKLVRVSILCGAG